MKKATKYPKNDNDYATPIALNLQEIKKEAQRVSNIKPFINNYNCEKINIHQD